MPIIDIQRRMAEQGRIRLGQKVPTSTGKMRPDKLDRFRFTSPNQRLIDEIAKVYGGTARPWDNDGKAEHEVITDARAIPVIVVKGGFSQWYEAWTKAGCQHRCDGEKDVTGAPCNLNDPLHIEATQKPTTRLSVMLSEIETLGVWRMESKGWNAAAELPSMAELAMHVGDYVPAMLLLADRSSIIQTAKGPQTSRFVVPVLDLQVSKRRLIEIMGGQQGAGALEQGPARAAIESAAPDYAGMAADATTVEEIRAIWGAASDAGRLTPDLRQALEDRAKAITPPVEPGPPDQPAAGDDVDALWMQIVAAAGAKGMTTAEVEAEFLDHTGGIPVSQGDEVQMTSFLRLLKTGEAAA